MSIADSALRAIALTEATKVSAELGPAEVLKSAKLFFAFMMEEAAQLPAEQPAKPAAVTTAKSGATAPKKPAPTKPTPAKTAAKPPVKPVETEEQAAERLLAEADAEQVAADEAEAEADGEATATLEDVGQVISDLLAAKKRDDCVALLGKFGATSKSGVKPEDYAAFVAEGNELLLGA